MAMRITKSIQFDAAHFIDAPEAAAAGRPYARMHGHSFTLEASVAGEPGETTGWVADFADLEAALGALRDTLDHTLLNEIDGLERPTLENLCRWAAGRLRTQFPGLVQVRVARPSIGEACVFDID
ncbi:MAG: 6-carboxytetrahydropterin synthase [Pseudomonadota bacterium]